MRKIFNRLFIFALLFYLADASYAQEKAPAKNIPQGDPAVLKLAVSGKEMKKELDLLVTPGAEKVGPLKLLEVAMNLSNLNLQDEKTYTEIDFKYEEKRGTFIASVSPEIYKMNPYQQVSNMTEGEEGNISFTTSTEKITSADMRAFIDSLSDFDKFSYDWVRVYTSETEYVSKMRQTLLRVQYLTEANWGAYFANPCKSAKSKLKLSGQWQAFEAFSYRFGMSGDKWLSTCDETIKAYRMLTANPSELTQILAFRKYKEYNHKLYENQDLEGNENVKIFLNLVDAIDSMHEARFDVMETLKPYLAEFESKSSYLKRVFSIPIIGVN